MKHILLFILSLLPMLASAEAVEINGIWYNLISKGKIAEVTSNPNGRYTGAVEIPESVTYNGTDYRVTCIKDNTFTYCVDMASVTIPSSVTTIGYGAFWGCRGLTSISIPNGVTSIDGRVFYGCSGLNSITISKSVVSIGNEAFHDCIGLQKVIVPDIAAWCGISFEGMEANPLYYAYHLYSDETTEITNLVIPDGVTSIKDNSFLLCAYLASVTIPNSVTSIGDGTFYGCSGLTSLTIPNSVTSTGRYAFASCLSLTSVTISNCMNSVGYGAFSNCSSLSSVAIPNSVNSIGSYAFNYCSSLTSVTIPESVTSIGESSFGDCSSLSSIIIPNSVTSIGNSAFHGSGLTSIIVPNSVKSIRMQTFYGCANLTRITIPESVTLIDYSAFANCAELTDVYCYAEKIPQTSSDVFEGSYIEYATLHVPASSLEQYKATAPWSDFGSKVPIDGDEPNPEPKKCATPTISYVDGELVFNSETEDAVFVSEITDADIKKHYSKSVSLTATYNICVFATKEGFENSDTIQATLCWIDAEPISEGLTDEDAVAEVKALPVLINSQGGIVTIQGAPEGTPIAIYGTNGKDYGSAVAAKDRTTIATSLHRGSVAIIMIGEKAVKVAIR